MKAGFMDGKRISAGAAVLACLVALAVGGCFFVEKPVIGYEESIKVPGLEPGLHNSTGDPVWVSWNEADRTYLFSESPDPGDPDEKYSVYRFTELGPGKFLAQIGNGSEPGYLLFVSDVDKGMLRLYNVKNESYDAVIDLASKHDLDIDRSHINSDSHPLPGSPEQIIRFMRELSASEYLELSK